MQNLLLDLRWGARRLLSAWQLALTCIVFLGVAIGATTTVFSFVNAALLRPLPYPEPNRLVAITEDDGTSGLARILVSAPTLAALRRSTDSFESIGAYADEEAIVEVDERVQTLFVTPIDSNVLPTLRTRPQLGSVPTAADHAAMAKVALVSDAFWRTHLKGARDAIGRSIRINDTAYQVLGVMPPWFAFPYRTDVWIPLNERVSRWLGEPPQFSVVARLSPGLRHDQAREVVSIIEARLRQDDPSHWRRMHIVMRDDAVFPVGRSWKRILFLFLGGVGGVLLIACVNVGTLLSMRAREQQGSIAVRAAIGATPARLIAHNLVEAVLLVAAAAALGLALSVVLVPLVEQIAAIWYLPNWFRTDVDYRVLFFVTGLAGLAVVLVGVRAALQSIRLDVAQLLRGGADGGHTSRDVSRGGARGVVVQVALSVVLAVTSTLVAVTYQRVTTVDPGYAQDRLIRVLARIDTRVVPNEVHRWEKMSKLAESVRQLPGVESATLRGDLSAYRTEGAEAIKDIELHGEPGGGPAMHPGLIAARRVVVDPNYFSALQIPVLRGRAFNAADNGSSAAAVVLSATAAEMLWPKLEAVGRVMRIGSNGPQLTVVGVVGDVRRAGTQLGEDGIGVWPIAMLYLSSAQAVGGSPSMYVRVAGNADAVRAGLGPIVLSTLGPTPFLILTPEMQQDDLVRLLRTSGVLFGASAILACLLAGLGAYAVVRFRGQQLHREIGIRMALGATAVQIRWDVARECLHHGGVGLTAGLIGSAVLAQVMRSAIWGVSPFSPIVYGAVTLTVVFLMGGAGYAASRRASRVDPASAMRN